MEQERPIEKLLRQAAQARRTQAGAPQELHPANRRMLQSEVARKYAAAGRGATGATSFFDLFMPRLAWGLTVLVGLGIAASLMLPRKGQMEREMFFAKNERAGSATVMNETLDRSAARSAGSATLTAPTEGPALARAERDGRTSSSGDVALAEREKDSLNLERRRADAQTQRSQLALNEPAAPAAVAPAVEEKQKKEVAVDRLGGAMPPQTPASQESLLQRRYALAAPAQPNSAAPSGTAGVGPSSAIQLADESRKAPAKTAAPASSIATTSLPVAKAVTSSDVPKRSPAPIARVSQRFVETVAANKTAESADKPAVASPILASFELQQVGREVRIVDSDGSVYSGSFQAPETFTYLESAASQKSLVTRGLQPAESQPGRKGALDDSKLQMDLSYPFKVSGTNQSSKQVVTFNGQILTPTNALSLLGPAGTVNGNRIAPPELNPLPLPRARISGKALIGTNKEVEVNAVPAH